MHIVVITAFVLINISKTWYQLRAIHIFVEHIVTKFDGTEIYAKRLQLVSHRFISHINCMS